mmetsp:Transcript_3695/g.4248  ORF Transcript_3695/g.4248 Transcript_3695/m.4248 type:complete len:242 (+) Transcript_3695:279-1004(+)
MIGAAENESAVTSAHGSEPLATRQGASRGKSSSRMKFKIVLLGEGRVGKTSILLRFCKNEYDGRQPPTLNASYMDRRINIGNQPVQLSIWDTAGQERFHALGPIYYRDADAALLVYDITDAESFTKVRKWVRELRKIVGENIAIAIAGNKSDLEKNRHVSEEEALKYAESVGAKHFHTSAKLNRGLDDVFLELSKKVLKSKASVAPFGIASEAQQNNRQKRPQLVLVDDTEPEKSSQSSCC